MKRYLPNPIQILYDLNKSVNKYTKSQIPSIFSKKKLPTFATFATFQLDGHLLDLPMTHSDANEQMLFVPPPRWQETQKMKGKHHLLWGDNLRVHPQERRPYSGITTATVELLKISFFQKLPPTNTSLMTLRITTLSSTWPQVAQLRQILTMRVLGNQYRKASLPLHNTKKNETSKKAGH